MKYRKKPVVVDVVQFDGWNWREVYQFMSNEPLLFTCDFIQYETIEINTLEGKMTASIGDFIIKGVKGEFYPCKPDIFALTYEPVEREWPKCAKELFEELGYKQVVAEHDTDIRYSGEDGVIIEFRVGMWNSKTYVTYVDQRYRVVNARIRTDVKFHLAIHQQMKELGWIE